MSRRLHRALVLASALALVMTLPASVSATHAWGSYHWARTSNPFTLKLGDNVNSTWDLSLATTSFDWSKSAVLRTTIVPGTTKAKVCRATVGMVEVCNATYGSNGWLGMASIWINGGGHIAQGTVKLNDTYFNTATYNTTPWRNLVMCQEVGHTFGLGHQDEKFDNSNLGSCMDYTGDPDGPLDNQHPNAHDYDMLVAIYTHLDSTTTVASAPASAAGAAGSRVADKAWGRLVKLTNDGHGAFFVRDLGRGNQIITHVLWAD